MLNRWNSCLIVIVATTPLVHPMSAISDDATAEVQKLSLWKDKAPIGNGEFEQAEVWLTYYRPTKPNGTGIVICPGGGYAGHAKEPEGFGIARWLNQHGIAGVVLEYRLPAGRSYVPLLDAQRAIRTTRLNAKEWGIDSARIGIIGFSAGGHLASTAATHFDAGDKAAAEKVDQVSCRPDFAILVYPVISMGEKAHAGSRTRLLGENPSPAMIDLFSNEKQVTDKTPPIFLAHPVDDKTVAIDNSQMLYDSLQVHKIPSKFLILPSGGHGLNGYQGPMWDAWQEQSLAWVADLFKKS